MSRNELIFFWRTLYNLTSYPANSSHALKIWEKELTEYRDIKVYCVGFVWATKGRQLHKTFLTQYFKCLVSYSQSALRQVFPITMYCTYRSADWCCIWNKKPTLCYYKFPVVVILCIKTVAKQMLLYNISGILTPDWNIHSWIRRRTSSSLNTCSCRVNRIKKSVMIEL